MNDQTRQQHEPIFSEKDVCPECGYHGTCLDPYDGEVICQLCGTAR